MLYKLTDKDGRTRNNTQWGEGVTHTASGEGDLCTGGWLHAYTDPLLAVLLNPIYGDFNADMRLWECEGVIGATDHGLKVGCTSLTTLREIPVPEITTEQRVCFGILCSLAPKRWRGRAAYVRWARGWLDGSDRSKAAAWAAWAASGAAVAAEPEAAEAAAWAAAWAASGAAVAAEAEAAEAAAWAAEAEAAAWAAAAADIDLIAIAHEAVQG